MTLPALRRLTSLLVLCGALAPITLLSAANASEVNLSKPAILLAQNYHPSINLADYLVSEKLDGVRAIWDGKALRFRSGQVINAPAWFVAKLPAHALDGELWMGRRSFDRVSAATRRLVPLDAEWKAITYQVVELPGGAGTFSERLLMLKSSVAKMNAPWLQVPAQFTVVDDAALQLKLQKIVRAGGEGLMLHRADAVWQTGRSEVLLKLKMQLDAEAKVIAYLPGKGKYLGMMGALEVEMPDGKRFRLGTGFSDAQRRTPPEIGSMVTYRYRDLTPQGLPRFANFLRIREIE
ncbi:DNA ligase [Solimicrobium silvestre]|uniref:ATP dependent DNA ligase domain n=1 Tax=Solimicrobium silvestre TaxID=2099400 RepID=A0A2S9GX88_9BURK|nr:DNA ligase [Solimicrobium silvestre]PRC92321.1 ATP dependent DNA ligase domain [Solimicrobium silvestre]